MTHSFKKPLIDFSLLFLILTVSCDKDFNETEPQTTTSQETSRFKVNTGDKVSTKAINYLKQKTNNSLKVNLGKKLVALSYGTMLSRASALGTVDTSKEIVVTNTYNVKHTFKVITDDDTSNSVLNIIVVETEDGIFEYFMKYIFEDKIPLNSDGSLDLQSFTGVIETYNNLGELTGTVTVSSGSVVAVTGQNSPCPDEDNEEEDDPDDDGNTSNDGSPGGATSGDGSDDGSDPDPHGGGEFVNPYDEEGCVAYVQTITCWCENELVGAHDHTNESSFLVIRCGSYVVTTAQRNMARDPGSDDPCGFGDTGVLIDEEIDCSSSEEDFNAYYSANSPFDVDLSAVSNCYNIDITTVQENQKFMCIYNKLSQSPKFKVLFLDTFGESDSLNVKFELVDHIPGANGQASILPNSTVNQTTGEVNLNLLIKIDKSYMNSHSAIGVARTIMHESIHAYLILKHVKCNLGTPFVEIIEDIDDKSLEELLNYYYDTACPEQEQHEFMFEHMIPTMSEILADVRDDFVPLHHQQQVEDNYTFIDENNPLGLQTPWDWLQFYDYFSMVGLTQTNAFINNIENNPARLANYTSYRNIGSGNFSINCID